MSVPNVEPSPGRKKLEFPHFVCRHVGKSSYLNRGEGSGENGCRRRFSCQYVKSTANFGVKHGRYITKNHPGNSETSWNSLKPSEISTTTRSWLPKCNTKQLCRPLVECFSTALDHTSISDLAFDGHVASFTSSFDVKSGKKARFKYTLFAQKVVELCLQVHHKGLLP